MTGIAVVLGGAAGAWEELAAISKLAPIVELFAVNDAAVGYPGALDAFVTLHPEKLPDWIMARRRAGRPEPKNVVSHIEAPHVTRVVDYRWPGMNASGSSGLFAAKVALESSARPVVLCGVPMQASRAHFFDGRPWSDVDSFLDAWRIALPFLKDRVRSMSGWTADLLGSPDAHWLATRQ